MSDAAKRLMTYAMLGASLAAQEDSRCPCGEPWGHERDCGLPYWRGYLNRGDQ